MCGGGVGGAFGGLTTREMTLKHQLTGTNWFEIAVCFATTAIFDLSHAIKLLQTMNGWTAFESQARILRCLASEICEHGFGSLQVYECASKLDASMCVHAINTEW